MRRSVGSITHLGPNHYRVSVSAGYDSDGGRRRKSRSIRGTHKEAEALLSRLLLETSQTPVDSTMTTRDYLVTMWLPWVNERVRKMTYAGYEKNVRLYLNPILGDVRLDRLEPYRLDKWLVTLASQKSRRKDAEGEPLTISPQTRLHAYRTLHAALSRAVKWRMIPVNPLDAVDQPKVSRTPPEVLDADEANAYLDAFVGHQLEPLVLIALGAGLRRSELAALSWSDIDFDAGTVSVTRGLHERGGEVYYEPPKTERSERTLSLPSWCLDRLRVLRGVGPLVSRDGAPMPPMAVSSAYAAHVHACEGLRYVHLKNLRHSHGTILLAGGADLVTVSRRLGHSTVVTTDTFYLRPGTSADEKAARSMDTMRRAPSRAK